MQMPEDPMILYSAINMKLRDYYSSLDELCDDLGLQRSEIEEKLRNVGFEYNEKLNKFW